MYRLFINYTYSEGEYKEFELDLPNDVTIKFNKTLTDFGNPQAIKTGFSNTITIKSTKNNNIALNNIYRNGSTYVDFNIFNKVKYTLLLNGEMISKGYVKFNNIKVNQYNQDYNITLYDELGDFFYNMKYKEDGSERTLADLNYGLVDENLSYTYDHDYVLKSWSTLDGYTLSAPNGEIYPIDKDYHNYIHSLLVPIIGYTGLYDEFDSNKILVKSQDHNGVKVVGVEPKEYDIEQNKYIDATLPFRNETYTTEDTEWDDKTKTYKVTQSYDNYKGWELFEVERNLHPFEVGSLTANRLPIGVNLGKTWLAICDSYNLDSSFLEDPFQKLLDKTYLTLKGTEVTNPKKAEETTIYESDDTPHFRSVTRYMDENKVFKFIDRNVFYVRSKDDKYVNGGNNLHLSVIPKIQGVTNIGLNDASKLSLITFNDAYNGNNTLGIMGTGKYTYYRETDTKYREGFSEILTVCVLYYTIVMKDRVTGNTKTIIIPISADDSALYNFNTNVISNDELLKNVEATIKLRTWIKYCGLDTNLGRLYNYTRIMDNDSINGVKSRNIEFDFTHIRNKWYNNSKVKDGEFIADKVDIYVEGFSNDYDVTINQCYFTYFIPINMWAYRYDKYTKGNFKDDNKLEDVGLEKNSSFKTLKDIANLWGFDHFCDFLNFGMGMVCNGAKYEYAENNDMDFTKNRIYIGNAEYNTLARGEGGIIDETYSTEDLDIFTVKGVGTDVTPRDPLSWGKVSFKQRFTSTNGTLNLSLFLPSIFNTERDSKGKEITTSMVNKEFQIWDEFDLSSFEGASYTLPTISKNLLQDVKLFDLFIGVLKMFNREMFDYRDKRYIIDSYSRYTLFLDRGDYFDLTNYIDYSSSTITPSVIESHKYNYSIEPIESYAETLLQKSNKDYQIHQNKFEYSFSTEPIDVLKDIEFKTAVKYQMSSSWFSPSEVSVLPYQYTAFNKGASFKQTLFGVDANQNIVTKELQNIGLVTDAYQNDIAIESNDNERRLCFFDKDLGAVDFEKCLVTYNGNEEMKSPITLTDDISVEYQINNNPCYVIYPRRTSVSRGKVMVDIQLNKIAEANDVYFDLLTLPKFDNCVKVDDRNIVVGYTNLDNDSSFGNLYYEYFDLYNKYKFQINNRLVTYKVNLPKEMLMEDRFWYSIFYFDNCYWVINKIKNFDYTNKFNEIEFAQIDYDKYLSVFSSILSVEEES